MKAKEEKSNRFVATVVALCVALMFAVGAGAQPGTSQMMSASPEAIKKSPNEIIREIGFDQNLNAQLPLDAEFRDEAGNIAPLGKYFGKKPVVVAFVYYDCPMLCTMVLNGLTKTLRVTSFDVGKEFDVVVISFDPRETPELAAAKKEVHVKEYRRAGTAGGWHFLTGEQSQITRVTQAAGFRYSWDEKTQQFAHASGILVVTPEGKISRYFYGIEYAPRDLRLGLVEASAGKVGSPVDQVLLFCYHYDPSTGKYGFAIMNALRAGGGLTVLLLGGFMVMALRRERRGNLNAERTRA